MQQNESLVTKNQPISLSEIILDLEIKNIVSNISKKDIDPLATAKAKAIAFNIPYELRETKAIIENLINLHSIISPRWDAYKQHIAWQSGRVYGSNRPIFIDESGKMVYAKYALAPCNIVNTVLNEFVSLTLKIYSPEKLQELMNAIKLCHKTNFAVQELRNIAIHSEEAMEREALNLIFRVIQNNPNSYIESIENLVRTKYSLDVFNMKPKTIEIKMALLKALVVDFPLQLKNIHIDDYPEMVFPYFDNYMPLVQSELELLKVPFLLQNLNDQDFYTDYKNLTSNYLRLYKILDKIYIKHMDEQIRTAAIRQFVAQYPEIFGVQELAKKVFTFVGAGFPLTGIVLHILTGGASINLIDHNKRVVEDIRKLINITDNLGITCKGAIQIIHADALDIEYLPTEHDTTQQQYNPKQRQIYTDILDLASALSAEKTRQILENNAKSISIIRKRTVRGASEFLYERFANNSNNNFCLIGEATPPQQLLSMSSDHRFVTCVSDPKNVNSTDLYINIKELQNKLLHLKSYISNEEEQFV